jgi:hypothetical protein
LQVVESQFFDKKMSSKGTKSRVEKTCGTIYEKQKLFLSSFAQFQILIMFKPIVLALFFYPLFSLKHFPNPASNT